MEERLRSNKFNVSVEVENDSILDFKSPESKTANTKAGEFVKPNNIKQKRKTTGKLKTSTKSQNTKLKQYSEKRTNLQQSQPTIESSFFKSKNDNNDEDLTADVTVALVCPLCFKTFKDVDSQAVHMKICACRNNVSTKTLLDAIELQKRQEDERKSLGLLAAPIVQKKKKPAPRRINSHDDADLQLALVLSKSLQEAEELNEINDIQTLSVVPNKILSETAEPVYKEQLEEFGFANSKPATLIKNKKRKYTEITVLQTRTQEERNRILTERIAEILMGNEPFTQIPKEEILCEQDIKTETVLKSHSLRQLCYKDEKMWDKARLPLSQTSFYVPNLSEYITPQQKQVEEGEEYFFKSTTVYNVDEIKSNNKDQNETEKNIAESKYNKILQTDLDHVNEKCENCGGKQYIDTLATNWGNVLNDSSASDIIMFVDVDKYIWAHKLVFYVRCSNILLDIMPNDNSRFTAIKEKICWPDVSYNIALAFLEFIYCGIIKKHLNIFENSRSFSALRNLARKYKVKELFAYLQEKETETDRATLQKDDVKDDELENVLITKEVDNSKVHSRRTIENLALDEGEKSKKEYLEYIGNKSRSYKSGIKRLASPLLSTQSLVRNICTQELDENKCKEQLMQGEADYLNQLSPIRHYSLSPDMFDDINDTIPRYKRKSINHIVDTREIQKSNDLNIANSFDPVTIDIDSTEIKDFVSFENIEENVNTLSNTPQSNKSKKKSINHFDVKKTKSNLSIFIEQFQMENAKSDFDTDSDITIIPIPSKFKRNPFNINNDSPDQSFRVNETAIVNGKLEKEKDVWDKFDCNVTNFQLDTKSTSGDSDDVKLNFDAMVDLTQLLEDNKENCTEKSVKNNSMNGNVNNTEEIVQNDISLITKDLSKHNANVMNLDNTRAQSDENENSNSLDISTDGGELSMYTMYKKGHKNNSIIKYRNFLKTCALNNSVKSTSEDDNYESDDNMDKENITLHSDVNIGSGNIIISEKEKEIISNLENSGHQSVPQSPTNFNNTIDNNNEDQNDFSVNITSPINRQRSTCKLKSTDNPNKLRYSKLESNINTEVVRHNLSMSSPTREINETNLIESPILIYSSPEIDILNVETRKNKVNNNVSSLEEFSNNSSIFEKHIYLANVHINNYDDDKSNKKINESTITNNVGTTEIETIEEQLPTKQRIRKFQRKSMSDTNLDINEKSTKNNASHPFISLSQSSLCNCGDKQISEKLTSPTIIRDSITPPPNYDGMETDELHAELRKYGLKLQKRSRAIKLLTYIYNELHPTEISISKKVEPVPPVIDSDDEEPPMKRKSYDKSNTNSDYRYDLPLSQSSAEESSVVIIDKETLFDESEPLTAINEALNIKNVFFKLIKDQKELHNKILTYEPLCIEFLHSMLKQEGFKCNMNTLMDFLDEQCITFYCQDMKYKRNRKK